MRQFEDASRRDVSFGGGKNLPPGRRDATKSDSPQANADAKRNWPRMKAKHIYPKLPTFPMSDDKTHHGDTEARKIQAFAFAMLCLSPFPLCFKGFGFC